MKNKFDLKNYFSSVELLVVISILAILASLVMPSLRKIYHSGRSMHCKNNLKNNHNAITSYLDDHNSQLPGPCQFMGTVPLFILEKHRKHPLFAFNNRLGFHLKEYSNSLKIHSKARSGTWVYNEELTCPENMELDMRGSLWRRHYTFPWTGGPNTNWMQGESERISYRYVFGYQKDNSLFNPWYFQFIENPSEFVALKDHMTKNDGILAPQYPIHAGSTINRLFFDGHVIGHIPQGF